MRERRRLSSRRKRDGRVRRLLRIELGKRRQQGEVGVQEWRGVRRIPKVNIVGEEEAGYLGRLRRRKSGNGGEGRGMRGIRRRIDSVMKSVLGNRNAVVIGGTVEDIVTIGPVRRRLEFGEHGLMESRQENADVGGNSLLMIGRWLNSWLQVVGCAERG